MLARLSDAYFTVRNDRYVLPVRAEAKSSVRGILHDASRSGTTVFIEPEELVELNNRLKQSELGVQRETLRVLEQLSRAVGEAASEIENGIAALVGVDLAFARAALAQEMRATQPEVGRDGVIRAYALRHPLLPAEEAVPNDARLGEGYHILVLSGPNAGGKTVALKSVALAALCVRAGLFVPAQAGSRVDWFDAVLADIGDEQDIRESLSTFSAHMANLARIVDEATPRSLVVLDEIGTGTDPSEGAAVAQACLEALADRGARVIATTHYNLLKEMAEVDSRFANASFEFDPQTLAPTYRLHVGHPGASSALAVAARMGLHPGVLARANQLLDRDDRRLDRMLSELAASRAALEHEQQEAVRSRSASEAVRAEYEVKLATLQERRETLYRSMREDLERGFREARAQVAAVVRELQSGGSARDATRAQLRLAELAAERREVDREAGLPAAQAPALARLDWRHVRVGDLVEIRGGGKGRLLSLPDTRGRVAVGVGSARLVVSHGARRPCVRWTDDACEARRLAPGHSCASGRRTGGGIAALRPARAARGRGALSPGRSARSRRRAGEREPRSRAWHRNRSAARRRAPTPWGVSLRRPLRPRRAWRGRRGRHACASRAGNRPLRSACTARAARCPESRAPFQDGSIR